MLRSYSLRSLAPSSFVVALRRNVHVCPSFVFHCRVVVQQLTDSTGYGRLVFVRLHPAHEFNLEDDMSAVQVELSLLVQPLFPSISLVKKEQVGGRCEDGWMERRTATCRGGANRQHTAEPAAAAAVVVAAVVVVVVVGCD
jgi:hypothetical protein